MALAFNGHDLNGFQIEKKKKKNGQTFFQFTPVLLKFEHKQIIANVPFDENHLTCFFYSSDNWDRKYDRILSYNFSSALTRQSVNGHDIPPLTLWLSSTTKGWDL